MPDSAKRSVSASFKSILIIYCTLLLRSKGQRVCLLDSRPKGSSPVPARGHHVVVPISVPSAVTATIDVQAFYAGEEDSSISSGSLPKNRK